MAEICHHKMKVRALMYIFQGGGFLICSSLLLNLRYRKNNFLCENSYAKQKQSISDLDKTLTPVP